MPARPQVPTTTRSAEISRAAVQIMLAGESRSRSTIDRVGLNARSFAKARNSRAAFSSSSAT
jgi:hypothetical protein